MKYIVYLTSDPCSGCMQCACGECSCPVHDKGLEASTFDEAKKLLHDNLSEYWCDGVILESEGEHINQVYDERF